MNLALSISIFAGGPGSGCNPDKGKCGRKPGSGKGKQWSKNQQRRMAATLYDRHDTIKDAGAGDYGPRVFGARDSQLRQLETGISKLLGGVSGKRDAKKWFKQAASYLEESHSAARKGNWRSAIVKQDIALQHFHDVLIEFYDPDQGEDYDALDAGGEGSGCNPEAAEAAGNKCGRPSEGGGDEKPKQKFPGPAGQPAPKPGKDVPGLRLPKDYRKKVTEPQQRALKKAGDELKKWKEALPKYPNTKTNIEVGDRVVLSKELQTWFEQKGTGRLRTFPIGSEATITGINPKVGSQPQSITVLPHKNAEAQIMNIEDVFLLKKAKENVPKIKLEPVSKSKVVVSYKTNDGAHYTLVRPSKMKDPDETRGKWKPHGLKGKFKEVTSQVKVAVDPQTRAQVFFAQAKKAPAEERTGGRVVRNPEAWQGTTVFVYRNLRTKTAVIREINAGPYGAPYTMSRTWRYPNLGTASAFLNKRWGIKQRLPKQ